jgi:type VI secretion system protein ImpA
VVSKGFAVSETHLLSETGLDGDAAENSLVSGPPLAVPAETAAPSLVVPALAVAEIPQAPEFVTTSAPAPNDLDPTVAGLCEPRSEEDPCGPDLDLEGDADYLNFLAGSEGILPTLFFSTEDGKPFDRSTVDLPGQIEAIKPLWERSRDLRLLVMRARLIILNKDLGGFAVTLAAIAEWLERFWDAVHPRVQDGDIGARAVVIGALDLPTVVFPLQYAPLFEARRIGAVTYRAWLTAAGEVQLRPGEQKHPSATISEALSDADPTVLAATRKHVRMLKTSLSRIRGAFMVRGSSAGLETLSALVDKVLAFVDPYAAEMTPQKNNEGDVIEAAAAIGDRGLRKDGDAIGSGPDSLTEAKAALEAIAEYYTRLEPSSPTLPLVLQAHMLIGKSFFEVMTILVPTQMEKAAFQIGGDQFFELPVGKVTKPPERTAMNGDQQPNGPAVAGKLQVQTRAQAIALLEQVQRFFRRAEPSSPVPMLCDRARALAERDFMSVLREVLPKAALKNFAADK